MAEEKNSFILYADIYDSVSQLDNERAGILFKTILEYVNDLDPEPEDLLVKMVFIPIKASLKRDLKKWEGNKEKKSKSGTEGNLKRWHKDLYDKYVNKEITIEEALKIAESRKSSHSDKTRESAIAPVSQKVANIAVSVSDSVSVSVSDSVNVIKKESPTPLIEVRGTSPGFDFSEFHLEDQEPKIEVKIETEEPEFLEYTEIGAEEKSPVKTKKEKDREAALKKAKESFSETGCVFAGKNFKDGWIELLQTPKWKKKSQSAVNKSLDLVKDFHEDFALTLVKKAIANDYQGIVYDSTEAEYRSFLAKISGVQTLFSGDNQQTKGVQALNAAQAAKERFP